MRLASATLATLAAVALAAAGPARADDAADARAAFRKGAELYRAGKWRDAITAFETAYRLKPAGAIHYNVARCRERLSEWPGALRAYHDYLREEPDARDRAAVRAAIGRIERRLAGAGVQTLLVYSDPPGAAVTLEGRAGGATPFHAVLPPGRYPVAISLDGYETVKQEIVLKGSASRVVDVVLRPAGAAVPAQPAAVAPQGRAAAPAAPAPIAPAPAPLAPAATPPAAPSAAATAARPPAASAIPVPLPPPPDLAVKPPAAPSPAAEAAKAPPPRPAEKRRVYTWIAAGAAVAAVAAGGYFEWSARRDAAAVRDSSAPVGATTSQLAAYQAGLDSRAADARSKQRTANVLFAAGAGAAAAGVTLFFFEKRF